MTKQLDMEGEEASIGKANGELLCEATTSNKLQEDELTNGKLLHEATTRNDLQVDKLGKYKSELLNERMAKGELLCEANARNKLRRAGQVQK